MTNEQFEGILNMIMQILEGCDDLTTAKKRIKNVYPGQHGKSNSDKTTKDKSI